VPIYSLNVTYPLIPEEIVEFSKTKNSILIVEEGQPAYIEDAVLAALRRAGANDVKVSGKDVLPLAGEYTGEVVLTGVARFLGKETSLTKMQQLKKAASDLLAGLPARPPGFCVGCPERPVFSAMKVLEKESGKFHLSADIGCHLFSTLPPFNIGNTVLGYGLGLASNSAVHPMFGKRTVTMMGDGGFWHNGLTSGIANTVFNKNDGILVIMKNGYSSATGTQELPSSPQHSELKENISMERALEGIGVEWIRTVDNYRVGEVAKTLKEAMNTDYKGLKVIVAEGECQLERQRKLRPVVAKNLSEGKRTVRVKYGVDEDTCTGDHSCIRLSGCPTLTIKDNPDPLRRDPVATVIDGCVGCGLCGENAHAAVLCPSFYRAEVIQNPNWWDRLWNGSSPRK
jgi:indolepyruvate ferredoxin oxidoreductase alpha subunit